MTATAYGRSRSATAGSDRSMQSAATAAPSASNLRLLKHHPTGHFLNRSRKMPEANQRGGSAPPTEAESSASKSRKRHLVRLAGLLRDSPVLFAAFLGRSVATAAPIQFYDTIQFKDLHTASLLE
jgi:hypothetical protein